MKKRFQVFVSSTYDDLREERQEVMQALLELDCIPAGMELFPAADDDQWTLIKRLIDECDYYIVIVGGRYGSVGPQGKSYTEMEYEYAQTRIPAMGFLHESPGQIPANKTESSADGKGHLARFRSSIEGRRHCKYWSSPKDLGGIVSRAIAMLMKTKPAVGWVRADLVPDESAAQEILKLRNRIAELERQITEAGESAPKGSEDLARGDETISLHFSFRHQHELVERPHEFTWSELLALLGPVLLGWASESDLKNKLTEAFKNRWRDKHKTEIDNAWMRDEDFQAVKIQLRALGLITKLAVAPTEIAKGQTYWTLTPYGDSVMTQVAAVRSAKPVTKPLT
jgi:hypothetical protein